MAANGFGRLSDTDVRRTSVSSFDDAASSSSSNSTLLGRPQRLRILIVRHGETDYNVQGIIQGQMDTDLNSVGRGQAERVAAALALEHVDEVYSSPLRRARDTATAIVEAHPNQAHGRLSYWLDDRLMERGFGSLEGRSYDRSKPKRDSIDGIEQMNVFAARLASFIADVVPQPAPFSNTDDAARPTPNGDWQDEQITRPFASTQIPLRYDQAAGGPPPRLNRGGCVRTIVVVAHGAAISAMMSAVLLDTGLACISAGLQRTRVWNCSITEVVVHNVDVLPLARASLPSSHTILNMDQLSTRPGKKAFVIERWADVRHLPDELDNAAASKGSADEMVGRQTG